MWGKHDWWFNIYILYIYIYIHTKFIKPCKIDISVVSEKSQIQQISTQYKNNNGYLLWRIKYNVLFGLRDRYELTYLL
jgi:hypothetical protein